MVYFFKYGENCPAKKRHGWGGNLTGNKMVVYATIYQS